MSEIQIFFFWHRLIHIQIQIQIHSCYTEKYKIFILATGCIKFPAIPLVLVYYSFLDVHGVKTVYLCICVFSCETLANIDSDILVTLAFQKYSTCHVYQHFFPRTVFVYLCICVFVYLYLYILMSDTWEHCF